MSPAPHADLEQPFIDVLRIAGGLKTPAFEEAFRAVPRHLFVGRYYAFGKRPRLVHVDPRRPTRHQLRRIYADDALLSHRNPPSSTSQPSLVASMLEALAPRPGDRVLEIGAGTGWNAGLLGHIVGAGGRVDTVDIQPQVAGLARRHLKLAGIGNVTVHTGDAANGVPDQAPFDRIVTTVTVPEILPAWMEQLARGGTLLATLAVLPGESHCLLTKLRRQNDHLTGEVVSLPGFMLFTGQHGVTPPPKREADQMLVSLRRAGSKKPAAPWASWHDYLRRQRLPDVAFFATLEGMSLEVVRPNSWLLSGPDVEGTCLITLDGCEIFGRTDAWDRLCQSYRKWVDLGAPSRSSYSFEVWPSDAAKRPPRGGWLLRRPQSQMVLRLKR